MTYTHRKFCTMAYTALAAVWLHAAPVTAQELSKEAIDDTIAAVGDLTETLAEDLTAVNETREGLGAALQAVDTIEALEKIATIAKYAGLVGAFLDIGLSFLPEEDDPVLKALDELDYALTDFREETGLRFEDLKRVNKMRDGLNDLKSAAVGVKSAVREMHRYEESGFTTAFKSVDFFKLTKEESTLRDLCEGTAASDPLFPSISAATYGSMTEVVQKGTYVVDLIMDVQRVYVARTAISEEFRTMPATEQQRLLELASLQHSQTVEICANALAAEMRRLNHNGVVNSYIQSFLDTNLVSLVAEETAGRGSLPALVGAELQKRFPHKDLVILSYDDVVGSNRHGWHGYHVLNWRNTSALSGRNLIVAFDDHQPLAGVGRRNQNRDQCFTRLWNTRVVRSDEDRNPRLVSNGQTIYYNPGGWLNNESIIKLGRMSCSFPGNRFRWYGRSSDIKDFDFWTSNIAAGVRAAVHGYISHVTLEGAPPPEALNNHIMKRFSGTHPGLCMTVLGESMANGTPIVLADCTRTDGVAENKWAYEAERGLFRSVSKPEKCIAVAPQFRVQTASNPVTYELSIDPGENGFPLGYGRAPLMVWDCNIPLRQSRGQVRPHEEQIIVSWQKADAGLGSSIYQGWRGYLTSSMSRPACLSGDRAERGLAAKETYPAYTVGCDTSPEHMYFVHTPETRLSAATR